MRWMRGAACRARRRRQAVWHGGARGVVAGCVPGAAIRAENDVLGAAVAAHDGDGRWRRRGLGREGGKQGWMQDGGAGRTDMTSRLRPSISAWNPAGVGRRIIKSRSARSRLLLLHVPPGASSHTPIPPRARAITSISSHAFSPLSITMPLYRPRDKRQVSGTGELPF